MDYVLWGWPGHCPDNELLPFFKRKNELSVDSGILLWGMRVVIPESLRSTVLKEIHEQHMGICKMKALARGYVWWPKLDSDLESVAKACATCDSLRNQLPEVPLHPWTLTSRPMERIHVDFCDFKNQSFLIIVDNYSKWLEAVPMTSTTAERTIEKLRFVFAYAGIPEEIVSDNGPQFVSAQFKEFLKMNGIKQTLMPPYHPASNGQAERAVQIVKQALKARLKDNEKRVTPLSLNHVLSDFLLRYRITPHKTTGVAPCQLFSGRLLRSKLSLVKPDRDKATKAKQEVMKQNKDNYTRARTFDVGEKVGVKTNSLIGKWYWEAGVIHKILGKVTYLVKCGKKIRYCHADHLRPREAEHSDIMVEPCWPDSGPTSPDRFSGSNEDKNLGAKSQTEPDSEENKQDGNIPAEQHNHRPSKELEGSILAEQHNQSPSTPKADLDVPGPTVTSTPTRRYPLRTRKPPKRLDL